MNFLPLPNSGPVSFNSTFQTAPHVQSNPVFERERLSPPRVLNSGSHHSGEKTEGMEALCRALLGEGWIWEGGVAEAGGKVKGDLISTLLGLKEWVWIRGEWRQKKNHISTALVYMCLQVSIQMSRPYLLNGSVHHQSAQRMLHPWIPGERKRENSYITV